MQSKVVTMVRSSDELVRSCGESFCAKRTQFSCVTSVSWLQDTSRHGRVHRRERWRTKRAPPGRYAAGGWLRCLIRMSKERASRDMLGTNDAQHDDALDMFRIGRVLINFCRDCRTAAA
jgi:hypothetical protein